MAEAGAFMNGFNSLANGQPSWSFGSFCGAIGGSSGGVWNDQWSVPNSGLAGAGNAL
jgi:hypothetical protein